MLALSKEAELQCWERQPRDSKKRGSMILGFGVMITSEYGYPRCANMANLETTANMNNFGLW